MRRCAWGDAISTAHFRMAAILQAIHRRWLADAMTRTGADPAEVERAAVLIETFVRAMDETLGEPNADDAAER